MSEGRKDCNGENDRECSAWGWGWGFGCDGDSLKTFGWKDADGEAWKKEKSLTNGKDCVRSNPWEFEEFRMGGKIPEEKENGTEKMHMSKDGKPQPQFAKRVSPLASSNMGSE